MASSYTLLTWLAGLLFMACASQPPQAALHLSARYRRLASGGEEGAAMALLDAPLDHVARPASVGLHSMHKRPAAHREPMAFLANSDPLLSELLRRLQSSSFFDPGRAREARERARWSGLLPILRADLRRGSGWDLRSRQGSLESVALTSDESWSLAGSLTFRLDRLLYASEESSLLIEERRLEEERLQWLNEIVRLYFEWKRLAESALNGSEEDTEQIAEIQALLDVMTGGIFSELAAEKSTTTR
ncbi:MAG: hypothetical protein NZM37_08195 [Sandaracinaceae bacterium]|nr:hypothetical protein [Sandaracinaceae bacterium]